jgi:prophage DNA circulation protein
MSINLNKPGGLEKLTGKVTTGVAGASTLLQQISGAIGNTWDIDEGSYGHDGDQILFHIFKTPTDDFDAALPQIQDTGGHRKVPIVFPYVAGQSTDDLGRKGEIFDIDVLIFGPNYKQQYVDLLRELDDPRPGILVHPVRGQITVAAEDWIVTHASDKKQAVTLKIKFIEHNFSVDYSQIDVADNVPSALTSAVSFLGKISQAIAAVQSIEFVISNTKNLVTALLGGYQGQYTAALIQLNKTFNPNKSAAIPGLAPTVSGQSQTLFNVATNFNDVFVGTSTVNNAQSTQTQELTAALATQQAIDVVSATRIGLESDIEQIEATESGDGTLIFYDIILMLKESAVAMQLVLELGIQTSNNTVITYRTPRDMSVREVCFANGLTPDHSYDVEVLNPDLLSMNLIEKGTIVKVPV